MSRVYVSLPLTGPLAAVVGGALVWDVAPAG